MKPTSDPSPVFCAQTWLRCVVQLITVFLLFLPLVGTAQDFNSNALTGTDIGGPAIAGSITNENGVWTVTAGGKGIGFASDQFYFGSETIPGDFDVRVRVASLKNTDLWAKAGLMARAGTNANSRFAAVFATPSGAGCLFQSRSADAGTAANQGTFAANEPFAWLRLQRVGLSLAGYASYDGLRWTLLGKGAVNLGTNAQVGFAVTSHNTTNSTISEFRDFGLTPTNAVVQQVPVTLEPLGPCSRRTAIAISEIMYHPPDRPDGRNLEFVEIYNSQPYFEDIGGWKLSGDIEFTFPSGTIIPGGGFLVVAAAPDDVKTVYGIDNVLGPYSGKLNNSGGVIRLLGDRNAVLLEVPFDDNAPWPKMADGTGHSLVLARPSYGERDPRAWSASRIKGGSPGLPDAIELSSVAGVRINECQLPDGSGAGFVELFNAGTDTADLSGLRLGSSPDVMTFVVPDQTTLPSGGFVQFTWAQLGFTVKTTGGTVYLESADGSRFVDAVTFSPQAAGTSAGRWPNGGDSICSFPQPTPGAANVHPKSDIVINEIHHSPISDASDEQFVELYNSGATGVDLSFWEFTSGITFTFPQGTSIPAGGYLVVAHNAARLTQVYTNLASAQVVGDFSGSLSGRGEHLVLSRPITVKTSSGKIQTAFAVAAEAVYSGGGRWNQWSDAGGSSLELVDSRAAAILPASWQDSDESARGEWTTVEFTGVLDNGPTGGGGPFGGGTVYPDSLHIVLLGEGECIVDKVEVLKSGNTTNLVANGTFEQGITGWTFSGNHVRSSLETNEGYGSKQSLHLRASGNGDTGANKVFVKLTQSLASGNTATLRARVKWLHGWPEILLRLHGNYLEAYGRMNISGGSGTPGARNSKAVDNVGPAFGNVAHFPLVPATNEPVVVSAMIDDPDGVDSVTMQYRIDPATSTDSVLMNDSGTNGDAVADDGIYSAILPAPGASKLVAFTITAADKLGVTSVFPPGAPTRECLVRFGDGVQSGAFGTYRLWVSLTNSMVWANRPNLSNEPLDSTFVYGNARVVYNAGGRFAGSPFHQIFTAGPASDAHFVVDLPKDDRLIGTTSFNKLHAPGNGPFDDTMLQREQIVYWLARKSGLPSLHRRFVHFYVNGTKKKTLMEDTQVGNDDLVEEFWPDNSDGELFKLQPWFEFPDTVSQNLPMSTSSFITMSRYTTTGNQLKLARYRWNWLVRGAEGTANNFSNALNFVMVTTDTTNTAYETNIDALVDVDEWMRCFAINHSVGNWDSVGYRNGQNTYAYKPKNEKWHAIIWDANIVFGNSSSDGPSNLPLYTTSDTVLSRWLSQGTFKRRYLSALYTLVNGPLQTNLIAPMLDAKYAAFQEHGVTAASPEPLKTWIGTARASVISQISGSSATFSVTNVTGTNSVTLCGTGPLDMDSISVNGTAVDVTWLSVNTWKATLDLASPTNAVTVIALNSSSNPVAASQQTVQLGADGRLKVSRDGDYFVFDYQVYQTGKYQLQATSDLANPNWQTVASRLSPLGAIQFRIAATADTNVFYRLVK